MSADKKSLSLSQKLSSLRANYQNPSVSSGIMRHGEGKPRTVDSLFKIQKSSRSTNKSSTTSAKKQSTKAYDQTLVEKQELELLRQFDLNADYGPCSGLSRMERWKRAKEFRFNPPSKVHDLVIAHSGDDRYTQCIWHGMKI